MHKKLIALGLGLALAGCGAADTTTVPPPTAAARPTTAPADTAAPATSAPAPTSETAAGGAQPTPNTKRYTEYPAMTIDPAKEYIATIVTEKGDIKIKLFPETAPKTVNSFVFLAREGYFNGITFHRVIPGFMAQTGDPTGLGTGGPGYQFENEYDPSQTVNFSTEGTLGMANAGPNTNGSQFFITNAATTLSPQEYTVFGQVIEGLDVVKQIDARDPQFGATVPGDQLFTITIEEK